MKKKFIKWGVLIIVLSVAIAYFFPKPLVRNIKNSDIISIMYRDDTWKELRVLYPSQTVPSVDEGELLRILNQSKSIIEVFSPTLQDGIPSDVVTIMISVSDGDKIKNIILGDWNRVTVQSSHISYRIIDGDSVLKRVLDFLQIDENIIQSIM